MPKRARVLLVSIALLIVPLVIGIARAAPPTPEPGFIQAGQVAKSPCTSTNAYEAKLWQSYGSDCVRLHFAFGPILAKPGQNDALIQPVPLSEKSALDQLVVTIHTDPPASPRAHTRTFR